MYVTKATAVLGALAYLASTAAANSFSAQAALSQKLKTAGVGTAGTWPKGTLFSFFIDYSIQDGPLSVYYPNPPNAATNFTAAFYEKNIWADAGKTTKIGNALYNIQIFDQNFVTNTAEGNYQSVQSIPLKDKKGNTRQVYININGRIQYTLVPSGGGYPAVTGAKILSIAVSSLEAEGISCVNVGVNPLRAVPSNPQSITEYIIDVRKAVCVNQVV